MSADYRVDVTIGPTISGTSYSWSINRGDPPALPEILDGLTLGWQFPDAVLWPVQPEPTTAALTILAADALDLAGIDRGTPILIRVWAGVVLDLVEYDSVTFAGRITEATGRPRKFTNPATGLEVDGWELELQAADYTADLAEASVAGYYGLQGASVGSHVSGRFALAGLPGPDWSDGGYGCPLLALNFGFIDATNVRDAVESLLSCYADGGLVSGDESLPLSHTAYAVQGWRRGVLRSNLTPAGDPDAVTPYRVEWVSRRYGDTPAGAAVAPARLDDVGGGLYGVVIAAPTNGVVDDASIVIDADYLAYDATWTRSKFDDPNTIAVTNNTPEDEFTVQSDAWREVVVTNRRANEAPVAAQITDSLIYQRFNAQFVGQMYLDDSANEDAIWYASGFRWLASRDPQWPVVRSLFPDADLWGGCSAPIVITGIPATQRPDGREWYVGVPRSVTWTFNDGEFDIAFDLYPRVPRPVADGVGLAWDELALDYPAVTWTQLDPAYSWVDYRLIRTATYG